MDQERKKPVVYIAGPVNSGKSTLVNSLLEHRICPDDASPSTLFPIFFGYSENLSAYKSIKGRSVQLPDRELREILRNRRQSQIPEKAEIFLPSVILRWCSLVDTPGIGLNADSDGRLFDSLLRADGVIFLFHQRGIDTVTHRFLTALAGAGMQGWISFRVNANLGLIDGTSLTDTNQALKSIFPGQSEIYAINTRDRSSTGLLSLFLQVRTMESTVRQIQEKISKRDRLIPSLLERVTMVEEEERFLLKLWDVVDEAEKINSGMQTLRDLPLIYGSMLNLLRTDTCRLTMESTVTGVPKKGKPAGRDPAREIASLLREIESNRELIRYSDRDLLKRAGERLHEKCRVMVAGPFSTGKTTFLNALLGETLLPAEDRATTS
ncbi:MAG: dynamin family protein, partial [Firmicutes bacterium]|nr:dynamin family protein [Bacillota bacterium]